MIAIDAMLKMKKQINNVVPGSDHPRRIAAYTSSIWPAGSSSSSPKLPTELMSSSSSLSAPASSAASLLAYRWTYSEEDSCKWFGKRGHRAIKNWESTKGAKPQLMLPTPYFGVVALRIPKHQSGSLSVQGVRRVWVPQQVWQECLEDVDHVVHGRPRLVDDI